MKDKSTMNYIPIRVLRIVKNENCIVLLPSRKRPAPATPFVFAVEELICNATPEESWISTKQRSERVATAAQHEAFHEPTKTCQEHR